MELENLVDQDVLTLIQALSAATLNAARLLGLEARFGSIEPGKAASFVDLEKDPRKDIRALRSTTASVHRGTVVPRSSSGR